MGAFVAGIRSIPAAVRLDALLFARQQRLREEHQTQGLADAVAYLDNKEVDDRKCNLEGCTGNSIYATCKKLGCRADDEGCDGSYSSGECKKIKDLHKAAMCDTLSKKECGKGLPADPLPVCPSWWRYDCRVLHWLERQKAVLDA